MRAGSPGRWATCSATTRWASRSAERAPEDGRHRLLLAQRRQADARRPHPLDGHRREPRPDLSALGHKVIRDNHLGDWGTQFGMILWGWKNHLDEAAFDARPGRRALPALPAGPGTDQARRGPGEDTARSIALEEEGKDAEAAAPSPGSPATQDDPRRRRPAGRGLATGRRRHPQRDREAARGRPREPGPLGPVHAPLPAALQASTNGSASARRPPGRELL